MEDAQRQPGIEDAQGQVRMEDAQGQLGIEDCMPLEETNENKEMLASNWHKAFERLVLHGNRLPAFEGPIHNLSDFLDQNWNKFPGFYYQENIRDQSIRRMGDYIPYLILRCQSKRDEEVRLVFTDGATMTFNFYDSCEMHIPIGLICKSMRFTDLRVVMANGHETDILYSRQIYLPQDIRDMSYDFQGIHKNIRYHGHGVARPVQ